jgi:hypothetical protein
MSYLNNYPSALEYFRSIPQFAKKIADTKSETYHIKFRCKKELARFIYKNLNDELRKFIAYHVCINDLVLIGGRFPNDSKADNMIFNLIKRYKES